MNTHHMNHRGHRHAATAMTDNELDAVVGGVSPLVPAAWLVVEGFKRVIALIGGRR
jgi:hypothetical protein